MRLKKDQICEIMLALLRSTCKKSFFMRQQTNESAYSRRILLTRPTILAYELYVIDYYLQICNFVLSQLNRVATLEEDLALLKRGEPGHPGEPIGFELRMAVVYRSEKKKIVLS